MPKFDIDLQMPATMRTVYRLEAGTKREAELAAMALAEHDPKAVRWAASPSGRPRASARLAIGPDSQVIEETIVRNPVRRARKRTLITSTNTDKARRTIISAATAAFGRARTTLVFEHDRWFATVKTKSGANLYSVVDVHPNQIGFELLESYEY